MAKPVFILRTEDAKQTSLGRRQFVHLFPGLASPEAMLNMKSQEWTCVHGQGIQEMEALRLGNLQHH